MALRVPLMSHVGTCIVIASTASLEWDVGIFPLQHAGRHPKDVRQKVFMVQFGQPFVGINVFLGHTMEQPVLCCFVLLSHDKKIVHWKPRISVRFPEALHFGCCSLSLIPDDVPTGLTPPSPLQRSSPLPQRHYSKLMKVVEAKRTRVCYFWSVTS